MSGIYIHVPFCKSKCYYCDFASYPHEVGKTDIYFACLYKEMKGRAQSLKDYVFDTVYIGGGTPSFVDPKYIVGAMRQIKNLYRLSDDPEITIEINPGTLTPEKLKAYKSVGINRFSVGLQSADDDMLYKLNRIHTAADFSDACAMLKGENVSADILLGLEDQTEEGFAKMSNPKFEIYLDKAGEYRFRLKARNGQVIASSEGYTKMASCKNGIDSVIKNADSPIVVAE